MSLLKSSGPAIVVELRKIPRFDFGPLNRGSIFDLFREQGDIYLDLGQSQESDQHLFASRIEEKLQVHIKQHRPIVFLTSPAQNPPSLARAIYRLLTQSGEEVGLLGLWPTTSVRAHPLHQGGGVRWLAISEGFFRRCFGTFQGVTGCNVEQGKSVAQENSAFSDDRGFNEAIFNFSAQDAYRFRAVVEHRTTAWLALRG